MDGLTEALPLRVGVTLRVAEVEALREAEAVADALRLLLSDGEEVPLPLLDGVALLLPLLDGVALLLPLLDGVVLLLLLLLAVNEAVALEEGEREPLPEALASTLALGDLLAVGVGVPLQMHWLLTGAPQATRQQSCGQVVVVMLGEELAVLLALVELEAATEGERLADVELLGVSLGVPEEDGVTVGSSEALPLMLASTEAEGLLDGLTVALALGESDRQTQTMAG